MQIPLLDLKRQYKSIKDEIDQAISQVIEKSSYIGGEVVERFEQNFADFLGVKHCISCGNGTDALEIALTALGVSKGDEVIVPAYTWVATANAVINVGAKPVFCDIDPQTFCIAISAIKKSISSRTKAIIPVHLYGHPADIIEIMELANSHGIKVIEDCAQAHGAEVEGKKVGTFGHVSTFSFFPTKNLGAMGDGGAMVTQDSEMAQKCFILRNQGQIKKNEHVSFGRNSRLDTLQASILDAKLKHLNSWNHQRARVAQWYEETLKCPEVQIPKVKEGYKHVYHLFVIQSSQRDELKKKLEEKGIISLIHYPKPLSSLPVFGEQDQIKFSIVNNLSKNILSIPMFPELTLDEVGYICDQIHGFFE